MTQFSLKKPLPQERAKQEPPSPTSAMTIFTSLYFTSRLGGYLHGFCNLRKTDYVKLCQDVNYVERKVISKSENRNCDFDVIYLVRKK